MADPIPEILPRGPISVAVRTLVEMIAACEEFQAWANVSSAAEAVSRIHHPDYVGDPLDEVRGLVCVVMSYSTNLARVNATHLRPDRSVVLLLLRDDDRHPENRAWSQIEFENHVGVLIGELAAAQGQGTNLALEAIRQVEPAQLTAPRAEGPNGAYWLTMFEIEWSRN